MGISTHGLIKKCVVPWSLQCKQKQNPPQIAAHIWNCKKRRGPRCFSASQGLEGDNNAVSILMAAATALCAVSLCWCIYPNRGWSSNSGSDLTKVTLIYNLSALCTILCVCNPVQCPGELGFSGIFIQVITQGQGHPCALCQDLQWAFSPCSDTRGWCYLSWILDCTTWASVTGEFCSPSQISWKHQECGHIGWNLFPGALGQCCAFQQSSKCFRDHARWTALTSH